MTEMKAENVGQETNTRKTPMYVVKTVEFLLQGISAKRDALMRQLARTRTCHTCAMWDQDPQNPATGQCRRKAPSVAALQKMTFQDLQIPLPTEEGTKLVPMRLPNNLETGFQKVFIGTAGNDWCGDWCRWRPLFGVLQIYGKD